MTARYPVHSLMKAVFANLWELNDIKFIIRSNNSIVVSWLITFHFVLYHLTSFLILKMYLLKILVLRNNYDLHNNYFKLSLQQIVKQNRIYRI